MTRQEKIIFGWLISQEMNATAAINDKTLTHEQRIRADGARQIINRILQTLAIAYADNITTDKLEQYIYDKYGYRDIDI